MRPGPYRKQVSADLDRWISEGLVPEDSRDRILASLPEDRKADGTLWIGMAGALLAGLAVIAFIADNWAGLARGVKLILLLVTFGGVIAGAVLTHERRKHVSNGLTLIAALIFAASVALLGQAFNMPGEPSGAIFAAACGALLLSAAGRSPAAGVAGMVFTAIWLSMTLDNAFGFGWLSGRFWVANALIGAAIAIAALNQSRVMWHAAILMTLPLSLIHVGEVASLMSGMGFGLTWDALDSDEGGRSLMFIGAFLFTALWAGLAAYGVYRDRHEQRGGRTLAGYGSWAALLGFGLMAIPIEGAGDALHRLLWLGVSIGAMAFGARERYGWIIAGGVLSMITAVTVIMVDLGLNLAAAAAIFGLAALGALAWVFVSHRNAQKAEASQ